MVSEQPERHTPSPDPSWRSLPVGVIVLVYVVGGIAWIFGSGPLAAMVAEVTSTPRAIIELGKGVLFVAATALALQVVLRQRADRFDAADANSAVGEAPGVEGPVAQPQQRPDDPAILQLGELAWNSPDLLMMLDFEGTILAVNPAWTLTLGREMDSLIGRRFLDLVHADDVEQARKRWSDLHTRNRVHDERNRWQDNDGEWHWLSWSMSRDVNAGRIYAAARDVTDRVAQYLRAMHDRKLLETAERLADIGSWDWDVTAELVVLSTGMRQLLHLDADSPPVSTPELLAQIHPEDRDTVEAQVEYARSEGVPVQFEFRIPNGDNYDRIMHARTEPHRADRDVTHLYGAVQDVTDQRQMARLKDAFLSSVSHELRTPLTVIHGTVATLQRIDNLDTTERLALQDALERNVVRLNELMTSLLDLERLGRGLMQFRPVAFDLLELTSKATASDATRIVVEGPEQLQVVADRAMVERILTHLLGNANKYAPTGTITVNISRSGRDGFQLTVSDEGPGIPDQERERIFEPFHRLDDEHPQPGVGVGLALVAEFVRAHNGHVFARPRAGGAELVVEIPGTNH